MRLPAIVLATVCAGCNMSSRSDGTSVSHAYVIDYSASAADQRQRQLGVIAAELESADPDTSVTVFRMGAETDEAFSGSLSGTSVDSLIGSLQKETARPDPRKGTSFAKMAEALCAYLQRQTGVVRVEVLTDGGNDALDPESLRRYTQAVMAVASSPHLESISFIGVRPGLREALRRDWIRAGKKLKILALGQSVSE